MNTRSGPRSPSSPPTEQPVAQAALHSAGMKVTPQRQGILSVLDAAVQALSIEEVAARMSPPRPSLSTIYRNLERFVQEGWAEPMAGPDQVIRFVRCRSQARHYHIQCERCGRITEVDGHEIEAVLNGSKDHRGFTITRHQLHLFGLCPACADNANARLQAPGSVGGLPLRPRRNK